MKDAKLANLSVIDLCKNAKSASKELGLLSRQQKDEALSKMADKLIENKTEILTANKQDVDKSINKPDVSKAFIDRLTLTEERIDKMAQGLKEIAALEDPVGEHLGAKQIQQGLEVGKVRVPLGVISIIYEARPNVTADAAGLAFKSGNSIILRGSGETINSNKAIANSLREGLQKVGLNPDCISLITDVSRDSVSELLEQNNYIDAIIPRGGKGLIKYVLQNSTIPVIETGKGNCHTFVDQSADLDMAANISVNAKVQRPGVCNAMETLLVHEDIKDKFLPDVIEKLKSHGVEIRGCSQVQSCCDVQPASDSDWEEEYLDLILAIKVVNDLDEAIEHIETYGTSHSEAIVTESYHNARTFLNEVDAAAVYVNASTRFTDGGAMGMGAEMGISTQKLHARGPMGLEQLTTTKFTVLGSGQIRS